MPKKFTSDKVEYFECLKNKSLPIIFGCSHHHESQALIERIFRTIERSYKAMSLQLKETSWDNLTHLVCLNYNLSYHTVLKEAPANLFLGYMPRQPYDTGENDGYDYPVERMEAVDKARIVSKELLKALQESPTNNDDEFQIGQRVKMKEAPRYQTKFEPSQICIIIDVEALFISMKVEKAKGRPVKRHMNDVMKLY